MSPFLFHVGELRSGRAEPLHFTATAPVDWRVELSRVLTSPPLHVDLELASVPGGIRVTGEITATVAHTCYRCLTEWEEQLVRPVEQHVTIDGAEAEDEYHLDGDLFDFEVMVRDELMLGLPIAPRCGPDCEGLVASAGSDLNTDLSEDEGGEDSPFSVLKDLLDTGD